MPHCRLRKVQEDMQLYLGKHLPGHSAHAAEILRLGSPICPGGGTGRPSALPLPPQHGQHLCMRCTHNRACSAGSFSFALISIHLSSTLCHTCFYQE